MIFTIGHSVTEPGAFLGLLQQYEIEILVDVRSTPFSRRNPLYNRNIIRRGLRANMIDYFFFGDALGGRGETNTPKTDTGQVIYEEMAKTQSFRAAIDRLLSGHSTHTIALMCSESDPLRCHRGLLISPALIAGGAHVSHIRENCALELHEDAEKRLMQLGGLAQNAELFGQPTALLDEAYRRQAARVAWRELPDIERFVQ